ncbi:hypothetical protein C8Q77DRAFT_1154324 [Trametes polyzona]|nr:hypothetical protein C8Q77DRAFT_1154324 [Trametes polyzona]
MKGDTVETLDYKPLLVQEASVAAMFALLSYELLITFDREVEYFWSMPFSRTTVLFLLNRYISLPKYPVTLTSYVPVSQMRYVCALSYPIMMPCRDLRTSCMLLIRLGEVLEIIPYIVWALFSAMRTHALTAQEWRLSVLVFVLLCVPVGTNLYFFALSIPVALSGPVHCIFTASFPDEVYIARE